jgi:hypothetical protein
VISIIPGYRKAIPILAPLDKDAEWPGGLDQKDIIFRGVYIAGDLPAPRQWLFITPEPLRREMPQFKITRADPQAVARDKREPVAS